MGAYGFFGVYGIGGNVTKKGERPDVDLLIATNARWKLGYISPGRSFHDRDPIILSGDWVAGTLLDSYEKEGWEVKLLTKIPSEYDGKGVSPKAMIRLLPNPTHTQRKTSIDIVYVRTDFIEGVKSLSDFEAFDVDEDGNVLPKVTLFEREDLGKKVGSPFLIIACKIASDKLQLSYEEKGKFYFNILVFFNLCTHNFYYFKIRFLIFSSLDFTKSTLAFSKHHLFLI